MPAYSTKFQGVPDRPDTALSAAGQAPRLGVSNDASANSGEAFWARARVTAHGKSSAQAAIRFSIRGGASFTPLGSDRNPSFDKVASIYVYISYGWSYAEMVRIFLPKVSMPRAEYAYYQNELSFLEEEVKVHLAAKNRTAHTVRETQLRATAPFREDARPRGFAN